MQPSYGGGSRPPPRVEHMNTVGQFGNGEIMDDGTCSDVVQFGNGEIMDDGTGSDASCSTSSSLLRVPLSLLLLLLLLKKAL